MPRGKELEQLPMANVAPSAGQDAGVMDREVLGSIVQGDQPQPGKAGKKSK